MSRRSGRVTGHPSPSFALAGRDSREAPAVQRLQPPRTSLVGKALATTPTNGLTPCRMRLHMPFSALDLIGPYATSAIRPRRRLPETCDTRSHAYLSGKSKIRCSATGTLPGRSLGVTSGCEALGTRSPPPDTRATEP